MNFNLEQDHEITTVLYHFSSCLRDIPTVMIICPVHPKTSLAKEQYSRLHVPTGQATFVILSFNNKLLKRNKWHNICNIFIMFFILIF